VPETDFSGGVMRTVFPCTDSGSGGDGRAGGGVGSGVDVGAGVGADVFGGADTDVWVADRVVTSGMAGGAEVAVDDGLGADVSLVPETDFSVGALPALPLSLRAESDAGGDAGVGVAVGFRAKVSARATTLATAGSEGALFDVLGAGAAAEGSKFSPGARSSGV
jgi:hypothetical protein